MSQPWRHDTPLVSGPTLVEASAGTGKTFSIADLVVRYVVEQRVPIEELLVVTFTRAATAELVDRVRTRLRHAREAVATGSSADLEGQLMERLATLTGAAREDAIERLDLAWRDFPKATISTIHGFCQRMLEANAFATGADLGLELVPDQSELRERVAADIVATATHELTETQRATLAKPSSGAWFSRRSVTLLSRAALGYPDAPIVPTPHHSPPPIPDPVPTTGPDLFTVAGPLRAWAAANVRARVDTAHARDGQMAYGDLLRGLARSLDAEGPTGTLATAIRRRYRVAIIDEFQDTDPLQWRIFATVFVQAPRHQLILIGDPKQAIYGFRGADVDVYLEARGAVPEARRFSLGTSYRSDPGLISAVNALFGPGAADQDAFAHAGIRYEPVAAHHLQRLSPGRDLAPFEVRYFDKRMVPEQDDQGVIENADAQLLIPRRVARDIVDFLAAHPAHTLPDGPGPPRAVGPGDIAVLVRTGRQAGLIRDALHQARVPSVIGGAGSVFATESALDLLAWIRALERPAAGSTAKAAAIVPAVGLSGDDLLAMERGDTDAINRWERFVHQLGLWRQELTDRGFMTASRSLLAGPQPWQPDTRTGVERLMARPDGERRLADLQHLAELAEDQQRRAHVGVTGLIAWLESNIARTADERADVLEPRRLERDAAAVRIVTVHGSKGLEYPIVYVPWLWRGERKPDGWDLVVRGAPNERRHLDVRHEKDPSKASAINAALDATKREARRLLYVALTRARHRCVLYFGSLQAPHGRTETNGPGLVLQGTPDAKQAQQAVLDFVAATPEAVTNVCRPPVLKLWDPPPADPVGPPRAWQRPNGFDSWRMHSYSSMSSVGGSSVGGATVGPDGHTPWLAADEQDLETPPTTEPDGTPLPPPPTPSDNDTPAPAHGSDTVLLDSTVRGGRKLGNALHRTLEQLDFISIRDAPDLPTQLARVDAVARPELIRYGFPPSALGERVTAGLLTALQTPLAAPNTPLAAHLGPLRLWDVPAQDRLNELAFDLPLPDRGPDHERVTEYAASLPLDNLKGWLYGEIDLVMRDPSGRYWVVDYKSNRVAPAGEPLTPATYSPSALRDYIAATSYRRQYTLYTLALHRFLKLRVPDYDGSEAAYDTHVGGVLYLFLRGMAGPEYPGHGVFNDRVPHEELVRLEALLG